jgi:hypothetical protein
MLKVACGRPADPVIVIDCGLSKLIQPSEEFFSRGENDSQAAGFKQDLWWQVYGM